MKYFVILFVLAGIGLAPFTLFTAYADCPPNQDWSYAPCLDQTNPDLLEKAKKEWARYADVKTDRFLEIKKNEMINAIQHDVLEQWLDLRKDSKNKNVFTYYSIYDENFDSYFDLPKKYKLDGTCIIEIDLQNGMEILRNDATVSKFLQKYPEAKFTTSNAIDESYPAQTSVFFVGENETLHVRIRAWSDERCFAPAIYDVMSNSKANTDTIYFQSPLKQFKSGISIDEIQCIDNLVLIQKYDNSPACVKEQSIPKLVGRNWGMSDNWIKISIANIALNYVTDAGKVISIHAFSEYKNPSLPGESKQTWLEINLESIQDGSLQIILPRNLIDSKINSLDDDFFVLLDGIETEYQETKTDSERILNFSIPAKTNSVEIWGYGYYNPELSTFYNRIPLEPIVNENGTVSENNKPYTWYDIKGIKQIYNIGESISFTETIQGYANPCVSPHYEILDGNTLESVWEYKIVYPCPFIKEPQHFKIIKTVPNENISSPILNHTGSYILRSYHSYSDEFTAIVFSVIDEVQVKAFDNSTKVEIQQLSKNKILSKGTGFDLPADTFTQEDLKQLQQKETELRKIADNPDTLYEESSQIHKEISEMQDRLQYPFQNGMPYHLVKAIKEKFVILENNFDDARKEVHFSILSSSHISSEYHALRIGINPNSFTLSEIEYQDEKIREYLGDEMDILYESALVVLD